MTTAPFGRFRPAGKSRNIHLLEKARHPGTSNGMDRPKALRVAGGRLPPLSPTAVRRGTIMAARRPSIDFRFRR
jgi:hypothetical protein